MEPTNIALPAAQLYIVFAIVGTLATLFAAHVSDRRDIANVPSARIGIATVYAAATVAGLQIVLNVLFGTDPKTSVEEAYVYSHAIAMVMVIGLVFTGLDAVVSKPRDD